MSHVSHLPNKIGLPRPHELQTVNVTTSWIVDIDRQSYEQRTALSQSLEYVVRCLFYFRFCHVVRSVNLDIAPRLA